MRARVVCRPMSPLPELLAPAGGQEAARAALQYGADAIYLGLSEFSARAEAENFTWESLDEITAYAHALPRPRKVYVAVNTLMLSRELEPALRALQRLAELRVDAVIMQDVGLARLARLHVPQLPLHASTQMTAHSIEGVRALGRLGFTRVVPARELALDEVQQLVRDGGLEVEIFIHGTLCYAYSGQCLFSSHATGRSGNRGRCTYGCRTVFSAGATEGLPFSMKDLALGDRMRQITASGVASLKIEGRMKSPLYVAAVTDYYRRMLDGALTREQQAKIEEDLRTIFSRPWTRLHMDGLKAPEEIIDGQTTGHRGARIGEVVRIRMDREGDWLEFISRRALELHDGLQVDLPGQARPVGFAVDCLRQPGRRGNAITLPPGPVEVLLPAGHPEIPVGAPVYCGSSQAVKRSYPVENIRPGVYRARHPLEVELTLTPDALVAKGRAVVPYRGEICAEIALRGPFMPARQQGGTLPAAQKAFERLGDTEWMAKKVSLNDPAGCFVPASQWNEARRCLAEALTAGLQAARERGVVSLESVESAKATTPPTWSLRLDEWVDGDWTGADEVTLPLGKDCAAASLPVRLSLPMLIRAGQAAHLLEKVEGELAAGATRWEVSSLAGLEILRDASARRGIQLEALDLSADWPLHTLNPQAAALYAAQGVRHIVSSPEDEARNLADLLRAAGSRMWILLAQFSPLFIAATGPAGVGSATTLKGRGRDYVQVAEDNQYVMLSRSPFWLASHVESFVAAGVGGFRVDLTRAALAGGDLALLWKTARSGGALAGSHEGNYQRGLK